MESLSTRLSAADAAWLRMDNPRNLMTLVGVWILDRAPDRQALRLRLNQRLLCHARFRQKVVLDPLGASWIDDPDFDLDHHLLHEAPAPGPGPDDDARLLARVGELAALRFDPRHPLWQFHLLPYRGGQALVFRLHHCLVDSAALAALLGSLADEAPALGPAAAGPEPDASLGWPSQELPPLPDSPPPAAEAAHEPPTRLRGPLEGVKIATWHPPLPLHEARAAARVLGSSVNALMLACLAGALGSWLREQGEPTAGRCLRVVVPVNLRPPQDAWQLGNCFGLAPVLLPIGQADIADRVAEMHRRVQALQRDFQPRLASELLQLATQGPKRGQDPMLRLALSHTTAVMAHLAGPPRPLALCGSTVRRYVFWVPPSRDVGVGASLVSYAGQVGFGLITDRARCADPQRVVALFGADYAAAVARARP